MQIEGFLSFLLSHQQPNGSFLAFVSKDQFVTSTPLSTTFATSLILSCLYSCQDQPLAQTIIKQGVDFLLLEKNNSCSWNYWQKDSTKQTTNSYPDDWDGTACALAALSLYKKEIITPEMFAQITKLLIMTEAQPGGPYYTWILNEQTDASKDIDPVVNANISYFLSLHDIHLEPLQKYLESIIISSQYSSKYYHQPEIILYFLSRSCSKSCYPKICSYLLRLQNQQGLWKNNLLTALAVSTLIRCSVNIKYITNAITHLTTLDKNDWKSYPFYIEQSKSETFYTGSPALTAAFVLEAISLAEHSIQKQNKKIKISPAQILHQNIVANVKTQLDIFSEKQNQNVNSFIDRLLSKDTQKQVTLLPYFFSQSLPTSKQASPNLISILGQANLYGWIAYTVYDNILDETNDVELLPLANICLRAVTTIYKAILSTENFKLFQTIMDRMEKANSWEYTNCHFTISKSISKEQLTEYPNHFLSDKSLPHALGPVAILLSQNYQPNSQTVINLLSFFANYLKARQLNDDAHDWQKDLQTGFVNSVSFSLLHSYFKTTTPQINIQTDISSLQSYFWETHIHEITKRIDLYLAKAHTHLTELTNSNTIISSDYLKSLLQPLEKATETVKKEKTDIASFLSAFTS